MKQRLQAHCEPRALAVRGRRVPRAAVAERSSRAPAKRVCHGASGERRNVPGRHVQTPTHSGRACSEDGSAIDASASTCFAIASAQGSSLTIEQGARETDRGDGCEQGVEVLSGERGAVQLQTHQGGAVCNRLRHELMTNRCRTRALTSAKPPVPVSVLQLLSVSRSNDGDFDSSSISPVV